MVAGPNHFQVYATRDAAYAWRLVSPNGRALGCAAEAAATPEEARAAISRMLGALSALVPVIRTTVDHRWLWRLMDGLTPVAQGASTQDRHVRCSLAVQRFVVSARDAHVDPNVLQRDRRSVAPCPERVLGRR